MLTPLLPPAPCMCCLYFTAKARPVAYSKRAIITTDAMLRFIEQPELAATMGKRSREIAEEKYDVLKVNAQMLGRWG